MMTTIDEAIMRCTFWLYETRTVPDQFPKMELVHGPERTYNAEDAEERAAEVIANFTDWRHKDVRNHLREELKEEGYGYVPCMSGSSTLWNTCHTVSKYTYSDGDGHNFYFMLTHKTFYTLAVKFDDRYRP